MRNLLTAFVVALSMAAAPVAALVWKLEMPKFVYDKELR